MAKMAEDASKENFRDFARREYEERRAEARLAPAQRTCTTLDEKAGITVSEFCSYFGTWQMSSRSAVTHQFNVLWLDPHELDSIPEGLTNTLLEYTQGVPLVPSSRGNEATRLRDQMRADALQPVTGDDDENTLNDDKGNKAAQQDFPIETVEEAAYFFRLGVRVPCALLSPKADVC